MASYKNGATIQGGFVNDPAIIYGDKYNVDSNTSYNMRILGDATGELGPFYQYNDEDN